MAEQPSINTERLVLRPFVTEDAATLETLGNDPAVASRMGRGDIPAPGNGAIWIENRQLWYDKGESVDFAITLRDTGELLGTINMGIEYLGSESMQLGFWLGKDHWNKGYCTEAALAMLAFGFDELDLHRIYARHFTNNPAAGKVLEKTGMTYEGTLRESFKKNGVFESVACYGILRNEYYST
jgi:RimJ/RimL family protein N-acetyltransferase